VIVDLREFRGKLPMKLYLSGLAPIPTTLVVGDFVLSPNMVVERKSLPDLVSSFQSGRLYDQMTAMSRNYKIPILLIEFDEEKPFMLQHASMIGQDIDVTNIVSKIVVLALHFPNLRFLWCRSVAAATTLFASLKQSDIEPEPDLEVAIGIGGAGVGSGSGSGSIRTLSSSAATAVAVAASSNSFAGVSAEPPKEVHHEMINQTALDMLRNLPGITTYQQTRALQALCPTDTLAGICQLSIQGLEKVLGKASAIMLHNFLHGNHADGI
jgi:DNA excision repair protein ERCC-4